MKHKEWSTGNIKKSLDLIGMKIHGDNAVGAGSRKQIGN